MNTAKHEYFKNNVLIEQNGNDLEFSKITCRTHLSMKVMFSSNEFTYYDWNGIDGVINLKDIGYSVFKSYMQKIFGKNEFVIVLFNEPFIVSAKKDYVEKLYDLIHRNWSIETVAHAFADANLFFSRGKHIPNLDTEEGLWASNDAEEVARKSFTNSQYIDFAKGYKYFAQKSAEVENEYGVANYIKAEKVANSLYWGQKILGLPYEEVAEFYLNEKFKVDELPFCSNRKRIHSTDTIMYADKLEDILEMMRNHFNNDWFISILENDEYMNNNRDKLLEYWFLGGAYKGSKFPFILINENQLERECNLLYKKLLILGSCIGTPIRKLYTIQDVLYGPVDCNHVYIRYAMPWVLLDDLDKYKEEITEEIDTIYNTDKDNPYVMAGNLLEVIKKYTILTQK